MVTQSEIESRAKSILLQAVSDSFHRLNPDMIAGIIVEETNLREQRCNAIVLAEAANRARLKLEAMFEADPIFGEIAGDLKAALLETGMLNEFDNFRAE